MEVALAVAVGATLLGAGVSVQSRLRQVSGLTTAKMQASAIAAALEMYYQRMGYYPNGGNGTAGAHNGTTVYTAIQPYLDTNFQPLNAYTGVAYTPRTYRVDINPALPPGQWWTDMSSYSGELLICVRDSMAPGGEVSMGMTNHGATMGTSRSVGTGKFYGVLLIPNQGYTQFMIKR